MADEEKKDKEVKIYVDGTSYPWDKKEEITYAEVVTLAYPDYGQNPKITYSVTYEKGPGGNPEGILPLGGQVKVKNGMEFRVSRTGES
jgi:hypothetical protein